MINNFKEYEDLFNEINTKTNIHLKLYIIGGAAMLYNDLKIATKDIDIIVDSSSEFQEFKRVLKKLTFTSKKLTQNNIRRLMQNTTTKILGALTDKTIPNLLKIFF